MPGGPRRLQNGCRPALAAGGIGSIPVLSGSTYFIILYSEASQNYFEVSVAKLSSEQFDIIKPPALKGL